MAEIPIIDIGPLVNPELAEQKEKVLKQIYNALSDQGFFYIVNHGLSSYELEFFLNEGRRFFELPSEKKFQIARKENVTSNGYVAIGVENLDDAKPGSIDVKEAMDICVSDPHPMYGSNQWPDQDSLPNWKNNVLYFINRLSAIGKNLMEAISLSMGEDKDFFEPYYRNFQSSLARFLRYPPTKEESQMGCGAHSDYGVLTLLLQDEIGGLQILYKGQWIDAPPVKNSFVINIGDTIEYLTNGQFKATKHRVINNSTTKERHVAALFYEPCIDMRLDTVKSFQHHPNPFPNRPATYGEHLAYRLSSTYTVNNG